MVFYHIPLIGFYPFGKPYRNTIRSIGSLKPITATYSLSYN